jgi:hypothetical protein
MKNKTIRISSLDLAYEMNVLNIDSLEKLNAIQNKKDLLLETDQEFFVLRENVAFRCLKPNAMPKMLKVQTIEINPDAFSTKIQVEPEDLLRFAVKNNALVLETTEQYLLPTEIFIFANKKEGKA